MVNKYYQKHKEKFQTEVHEEYQNLSEEEKQKKVEYMRNFCLAHKKENFLGFYKIVGNLGFQEIF